MDSGTASSILLCSGVLPNLGDSLCFNLHGIVVVWFQKKGRPLNGLSEALMGCKTYVV